MVRTRPPRNWRVVFLRELAIDGNRRRAAEVAQVDSATIYTHRANDSEFRAQWDAAIDHAGEYLEAEAFRRATEGVDEPLTCAKGLVFDADGNPMMVRKYSDSLMALLLKGARKEKYRENVKVSGSVQHSLVPTGKAKNFADELIATMREHPAAQSSILATLRKLGEGA